MAVLTLGSCPVLGADHADEPAGTDPEASAEGVTVLKVFDNFFFFFWCKK